MTEDKIEFMSTRDSTVNLSKMQEAIEDFKKAFNETFHGEKLPVDAAKSYVDSVYDFTGNATTEPEEPAEDAELEEGGQLYAALDQVFCRLAMIYALGHEDVNAHLDVIQSVLKTYAARLDSFIKDYKNTQDGIARYQRRIADSNNRYKELSAALYDYVPEAEEMIDPINRVASLERVLNGMMLGHKLHCENVIADRAHARKMTLPQKTSLLDSNSESEGRWVPHEAKDIYDRLVGMLQDRKQAIRESAITLHGDGPETERRIALVTEDDALVHELRRKLVDTRALFWTPTWVQK